MHSSIFGLRIVLYLVDHTPPYPSMLVQMENSPMPTFVPFLLTQERTTSINMKGVNWFAKAQVEVLDRIEEVGVDTQECLR